MNQSHNEVSGVGSTLPRLLRTFALRAAAALCALLAAGFLVSIGAVLAYRTGGWPASLAVLAAAFAMCGLVMLWLSATGEQSRNSLNTPAVDHRDLAEGAVEEPTLAGAADEIPHQPRLDDLIPRLLRNAVVWVPWTVAILAVVGPVRCMRLAIRGYGLWRTYRALTEGPAQVTTAKGQARG